MLENISRTVNPLHPFNREDVKTFIINIILPFRIMLSWQKTTTTTKNTFRCHEVKEKLRILLEVVPQLAFIQREPDYDTAKNANLGRFVRKNCLFSNFLAFGDKPTVMFC